MHITRTPSAYGQGWVYSHWMYDIDARCHTWIKVVDTGEHDASVLAACLAMELGDQIEGNEVRKEFNKRKGKRTPSLDFK